MLAVRPAGLCCRVATIATVSIGSNMAALHCHHTLLPQKQQASLVSNSPPAVVQQCKCNMSYHGLFGGALLTLPTCRAHLKAQHPALHAINIYTELQCMRQCPRQCWSVHLCWNEVIRIAYMTS